MPKQKSRRGFAALTPERRREIGQKGGKAVHAAGAAHQFTAEEARRGGEAAGRARWKHRPGRHLAAPKPRPGRKPGETRGRKADERKRAKVVRLRAAGLTLAEIGRKLGVSKQAVHLMLARAAGAKGDDEAAGA